MVILQLITKLENLTDLIERVEIKIYLNAARNKDGIHIYIYINIYRKCKSAATYQDI